MNENEKNPLVIEESEQSPGPLESVSMDSVDIPVNVYHHKAIREIGLPFFAGSTGKYREGRGFSYYREGFHGYCFFITVSGVGEITYRSETRRMERGDMVFVSSMLPARTVSLADDWHFCFVNIAGSYCEQFERLWNNGGFEVIRPADASHYIELLDRISNELHESNLLSELSVNLLITQLLTDALNEKYVRVDSHNLSLYPVWVQDVAKILSDRCTEELRISELAASFYMEQNNFIRRFKRYMGVTPKEYQIQCRMERATVLLSECDMGLSEIAARCGFSSHSFFTKIFKRLYGITPTEYRKGLSK